VIEVIREEARSGFPHLAGARVAGTVRVTQAALNDALRRVRQVPPGLAIEVRGGNEIGIRYGVFQTAMVIVEDVALDGGAPQVRLALSSGLVAFGLRAILRGPALRVDGRYLTVDLGALDHIAGMRRYWPLLRRARLRTTPGQVHIEFEAAV